MSWHGSGGLGLGSLHGNFNLSDLPVAASPSPKVILIKMAIPENTVQEAEEMTLIVRTRETVAGWCGCSFRKEQIIWRPVFWMPSNPHCLVMLRSA